MPSLPEFLHSISEHWREFPLFIRITFIVAVCSFAGAVFSTAWLYVTKGQASVRHALKARLRRQVRQMLLSEVVLKNVEDGGAPDSETCLAKFNTLLNRKKLARAILVDEIIQFRRNFSGQVSDMLKQLYVDLDLHKKAIARLDDPNWKSVSKGLLELFRMEIPVDNKIILKLTRHPRRYIREIARWYMIKLSEEEPLAFLENIKEPILPWEELEIFKLFTDKKGFVLPPVDHLLRHGKEPSIVSLAIRLAAHFNQYSVEPVLVDLLRSSEAEVRLAAIDAVGQLRSVAAEATLLDIYPLQDSETRQRILNSLGRIGSGLHLEFIAKELLLAQDFEVQKSASQALVRQIRYSRGMVDRLLSRRGERVRKLLKHFLNPITSNI